jgi:hypothetical protein
MVNQSGGAWKDPDAKVLKAINIEIEAHKKESAKKK